MDDITKAEAEEFTTRKQRLKQLFQISSVQEHYQSLILALCRNEGFGAHLGDGYPRSGTQLGRSIIACANEIILTEFEYIDPDD